MFGLTFDKVLALGVFAAFVLGPSRLPLAAATLGRWVRLLRQATDDAKTRLRDEAGPEFDDIDWKRLDPRQYDPRRIIREALLDDSPSPRNWPERASDTSDDHPSKADSDTNRESAA